MCTFAYIVSGIALIGSTSALAGDIWSYKLDTGNPRLESKFAIASGSPYASIRLATSKSSDLSFVAKPISSATSQQISLVWRRAW